MQDMNIYELIRGRRHYVAEDRVRSYMYQLMKALDHMHRNGIFHRCSPQEALVHWTLSNGSHAHSNSHYYSARCKELRVSGRQQRWNMVMAVCLLQQQQQSICSAQFTSGCCPGKFTATSRHAWPAGLRSTSCMWCLSGSPGFRGAFMHIFNS